MLQAQESGYTRATSYVGYFEDGVRFANGLRGCHKGYEQIKMEISGAMSHPRTRWGAVCERVTGRDKSGPYGGEQRASLLLL